MKKKNRRMGAAHGLKMAMLEHDKRIGVKKPRETGPIKVAISVTCDF